MSSEAGPSPDSGRERLLEAAYELFSRSGVSGVGVDTVIARAGVAKATLYRNFGSKDNLALAFLQRREERWTIGWLQTEVERRATDPRARLLAIFDVFGEWFQQPDYEGCAFLTILLELDDRESVVRQATVGHLTTIRNWVAALAAEVGIEDPDGIAWQWHILMKGSIVSASEGDMQAGARARELAELLLKQRGV
jgi:AcrR family transcriptional regulator